ncbi:hypothetical protein B0H21DRAFT_770763 [Amylocystis lapponica]|nr:hypothetical protein B0H21DRAFT_770763 [Amylocystis lapponica]
MLRRTHGNFVYFCIRAPTCRADGINRADIIRVLFGADTHLKKMPLAPVDDRGTQLYFDDSGAPPGCFHGAIYSPMLSLAGTHNVRLSTAYTAEELAVIQSGDYALRPCSYRSAGSRLRISNVITGGVSLLGWSHGVAVLLSFLAHADKISVQSRMLLEAYLRTCILHDPPDNTLGIPVPPQEYVYNPLFDTSIPAEKMSEAFGLWVSSYFKYSPHILSSFDSLDGFTELFADLAKTKSPIADPPLHQRPTLLCMSAEELTARSHIPSLLGNTDAWPRLRIYRDTIFAAAWMVQTLRKSWPETGRKLKVCRMEGANHFPHWHDPEGSLRYFIGLI